MSGGLPGAHDGARHSRPLSFSAFPREFGAAAAVVYERASRGQRHRPLGKSDVLRVRWRWCVYVVQCPRCYSMCNSGFPDIISRPSVRVVRPSICTGCPEVHGYFDTPHFSVMGHQIRLILHMLNKRCVRFWLMYKTLKYNPPS